MKIPKSDESKESKMSARRKFIRKTLQATGGITAEQVQQFLKGIDEKFSKKSMLGDMKILEDYWPHKIVQIKAEMKWIDLSHRHGAIRDERMFHNPEAKGQIGETLSALVMGLSKFRYTESTSTVVTNTKLHSILEYLKGFYNGGTDQTNLISRLKEYWSDSQRSVFLDAGTTTSLFVRDHLQYFPFPFTETEPSVDGIENLPINRLEVITNDRDIFGWLGKRPAAGATCACPFASDI